MGLLKEIRDVYVPLTDTEAPAKVVAIKKPQREPEQFDAPAPVAHNSELVIERDVHGFIESVTGHNLAGEKVTFELERDHKKSLERIKVRS